MNIIILGAKGNLGQQLAKVFEPDNHLIAWDKNDVDITDKELVLKKVADIKPDIIINAAAYNLVDKCEIDDEEYELAKKVNIDGPKFLSEAALENKAVLVHYSTDYVFNGEKRGGYQEDDEPAPINRYGKSKYHGEKRVLELSGRGLKWYIVRTAKLFGPPASSPDSKLSFFDQMLKVCQGKSEVEAVSDEIGCFTYTADLAQATKKLLESDKGYGIYHLVNSGAASWYDAVGELFKIKNLAIKVKPIKSEKLARPAKRPKNSTLLNTKFEQLRDYREALKEYLGE